MLTVTFLGTYHWAKANAVYDGDWKEDKRHGYGTYSIIIEELPFKQYGGGWKNDKRHGLVTLIILHYYVYYIYFIHCNINILYNMVYIV